MLDGIDEMYLYTFVAFWWCSAGADVLKGTILVQLLHLEFRAFLPEHVAVL
jgi:hypothetical protein